MSGPGVHSQQRRFETLPEDFDEYDEREERDLICQVCGGSGDDPGCDGILMCDACDGEGWRWWE